MMIQPEPPPAMLGARVLEYAVIDDSVEFTGRLRLSVGGEWLGPVPALAICEDFRDGELLLLHCDEDWEVCGTQAWNTPEGPKLTSIGDVKTRAERYYHGVHAKWNEHSASAAEALLYWEESQRAFACSFCGRTPEEMKQMVDGAAARICDHCVKSFHAEMWGGNE